MTTTDNADIEGKKFLCGTNMYNVRVVRYQGPGMSVITDSSHTISPSKQRDDGSRRPGTPSENGLEAIELMVLDPIGMIKSARAMITSLLQDSGTNLHTEKVRHHTMVTTAKEILYDSPLSSFQ